MHLFMLMCVHMYTIYVWVRKCSGQDLGGIAGILGRYVGKPWGDVGRTSGDRGGSWGILGGLGDLGGLGGPWGLSGAS